MNKYVIVVDENYKYQLIAEEEYNNYSDDKKSNYTVVLKINNTLEEARNILLGITGDLDEEKVN
ncbi:hypothetical protein RZE82_07895 [Mollicutes bacterium LVI A0039]|nr:hypothetical protein RZE82_07895 [Mollicutes bacterium LVI A0039]